MQSYIIFLLVSSIISIFGSAITYTNQKEMKRTLKVWTIITCLVMSIPASIMAQDKVEASIGADVVSKYIWRGQDLGGASIQPSVSVAYKGLSLTAWGSVGFDKEDDKEIDLTLAYETGNFSVSVTDYWYPEYSSDHTFEAQIGYDFGFMGVNWYTNFSGDDEEYASYFTLTAPFSLIGLDWKQKWVPLHGVQTTMVQINSQYAI